MELVLQTRQSSDLPKKIQKHPITQNKNEQPPKNIKMDKLAQISIIKLAPRIFRFEPTLQLHPKFILLRTMHKRQSSVRIKEFNIKNEEKLEISNFESYLYAVGR